MKKNVRKFVGIILAVAQLLACITVMNVSAATPDEGVEVVTQLFKDEFNYEVGAMTYAGTNNTWEALASKSDPKNVTIVQDETGNKYANVASELTAEGIYWSHGMRKYFSKISSGKVRLSVDVLMTAENCGEIHMGAGWNTMRPMVQFKEGAFYVYQESDAVEHPSRKLITASLNEWYEVGVIADYDDLTYEVLISQNDKLLYRATGIPIKDTAHGFSYLRFKNNNNSEFWVDNVVVEKITKADRENVISGVYDTLDGYESLTDGGVPTGNLTSTGWEAGAYGIKTTSIENEDGNKYINVPSDGSSIQYQIADTAVTTGILRFKFSIKSTDYTGAFVEVHDSDAYNSGGPVAMHIHDGYIYTKAGFWDGTGTKIKMGGIAKDEWFDAELTYNLDKNTYSIQLSRDGEVFNCLRDLTINKYNSQEAHTLGIKVLRFRDWSTNGGATQIDNFEFEYLTSETEQDYIRTETKFDNYETLAEAITSPWAATYKGLGELSLVDSDNGKAVSFPVSDSNHGIQYNISGGFSSGEMVVNFSVKSNNANGGALVTFPSGTGQETGLVGLHMYKGAFTTYVTGYSTGNKSLGKITANEWYDISISLDMSNKLYSIQIKHDGEVVGGLSNIDLIKYCSIGDLMSYIGSIRFVDWGKGIGGSGYELDNFSLSYVNPESKKNFIVTEANFDSSDSLSAIKGWTYDSGVALSDNKLSLPSGLNAQKALPLTDTGKLKVEYTLNANGGGAEVLAVSTDGEFALATFEGLTEAVTVTNIIDLENYKVTYSVNGETETTVDIADKTSGGALYNVNAIKVANTGEAAITVDDLTVSSYIAKPTVSDDVIKVTDAFGKVISKGTIVNPGVSTIEIDFGTDIDSESAKTAISLTSNSGDTPTFTVSTRAGKSVLTFDKALKAEETYTLSVSTALESTNGEALETEYSYSFTTDKADIFAEISAPTVGTKAIYTVGQLNSGDTLKLNARVVNSTESNADAVFVVGYYKDGILE